MLNEYLKYLNTIGSRYFIIAGIFFVLFYVLLKNRKKAKKLQPQSPKKADYAREIGYSILTICIFAAAPILLLHVPSIAKHTTFYRNIQEHGWLYFFLAFPLMFIIHDAYFYWAHRLMHHKKLFKTFHLVHHKSTNPSPWAAYSFHPLEAIVEVGIFPLFLFTMPIHFWHLFIFFFLMIVYNVYGHLGYELYPNGFNKTWIGKWINTSTSHNQHHQYFKGNYGLYFTFWDRMMGTLRTDYDSRFDDITSKKTT
ncbi:MAG: sterol desaturase family protein [Chitinophagaceae bacterium]|nr:MAG: sterol desaturase family protein [Chitinophagaceae bacterium]